MNLSKVLKSYRLLFAANKVAATLHTDILSTNRITKMSTSKVFAQRSITSFFTKNVLKEESTSIAGSRGSSFQKTETQTEENMKKLQNDKSLKNEVVKGLKRQREESSESETETLTSPKIKSEKKKKFKRLCIESSDESESNASDNAPADTIVKQETKSPIKTSPIRSLPEKPIKVKKTKKKSPIKTSPDRPIKVEDTKKSSPVKSSPDRPIKVEETKKSSPIQIKEFKSLKPNNGSPKCKKVESTADGLDYNPAKSKYHPVSDACWAAGQAVPYLALTRTLEVIEGTSARLKMVDTLANYFRSVIALTPEDLLPSVYMCLNKLAPAYHSLELGIAETYLMKAVGQCTGQSVAQVRAAAQRAGDLGAAAAAARGAQRTMFAVTPLTARKVFAALKEIANMTGQSSVSKKINKIQSLFVACKHSEAKFLIRSLEGKLRIGLAEQSVLQALAVATALTPPNPDGVTLLDASKGLSPEAFKSVVEKNALTIKTTYCECPNYELVIPALLQHGAAALPQHCRLTVGIPLKPMLAHPTKGVHEVFNRFEGSEFTCEWKYDGERAQIHVPGEDAPELAGAAVFSRNQENNTSKYPDILRRLPALLKQSVTSCILDCEAVAYDTQNKQILPFQILSTRKRKDATEADIKVQVCVFIFDLLYLNGEPLVREPFAERRRLLREHFNVVEGEWQLATSRDCSSMEEVQAFLEESVKGSCEGLMVKTLTGDHAHYDIARRSRNWLKLKKDYLEGVGDTIDVVIIGAYFGRGKRHKHYGGFLAAARDADTDSYQALCKLGTGFSDENLQQFTETLEKMVIPAPRSYYSYDPSHTPDVWVEARAVWEVRCADLSLSPVHRAAIGLVDCDKGISLRFPRFVRVREDKGPEQATSAQQVARMYLAQDQVKNQPGKKDLNYDDFY